MLNTCLGLEVRQAGQVVPERKHLPQPATGGCTVGEDRQKAGATGEFLQPGLALEKVRGDGSGGGSLEFEDLKFPIAADNVDF